MANWGLPESFWSVQELLRIQSGYVRFPVMKILVLTCACADMDEISRIRAATGTNIHSFGYAIEGACQVPEIRQTLHNSRPNTSIAEKLSFSAGFLRCWT